MAPTSETIALPNTLTAGWNMNAKASLRRVESQRWEERARALREFRDTFTEFDQAYHEFLASEGAGMGAVYVEDSYDGMPEHSELEPFREKVARAAGAAREAGDLAVSPFHYISAPITGSIQSVIDPIANWWDVYSGLTAKLRKNDVLSAVDAGIGYCEARSRRAALYETGVVGWLSAMLRLPQHVRDALNLAPQTASSRAAMTIVGALQAIVLGACGSGLWAAVNGILSFI